MIAAFLAFFADPWRFSLFIMAAYTVNVVQFAMRGLWWDALYWLSASLITASVTFRPH